MKRLDTLTLTAIKDMSETIVPDYIKFMLIYCFNGPTFTSIQKTWQTISLYKLKYHHLVHLLPYYRLNIIKTSKVLSFSRT